MKDDELETVRHLLPVRVAEMADVAGLTATLKLVQLRGGRRLYIPKHPTAQHWLVVHIGLEALSKLARHYQGADVEIDLCKDLQRSVIVAEYTRGVSVSKLAETYRCTERNIRYMVKTNGGHLRAEFKNLDWIEDFSR